MHIFDYPLKSMFLKFCSKCAPLCCFLFSDMKHDAFKGIEKNLRVQSNEKLLDFIIIIYLLILFTKDTLKK